MVLKFHKQHGQTAELEKDKIQPCGESRMAVNAKNSKTNKINLFSSVAWYKIS